MGAGSQTSQRSEATIKQADTQLGGFHEIVRGKGRGRLLGP